MKSGVMRIVIIVGERSRFVKVVIPRLVRMATEGVREILMCTDLALWRNFVSCIL